MGVRTKAIQRRRPFRGSLQALPALYHGGRYLYNSYGKYSKALRNAFRYKYRGPGSRTKTKTRKRRSGLGTSSLSGRSSYVRLSLMGRKKRFLGRVQKALAKKGNLQRLDKIRFGAPQNQQAYTWMSMFDPSELATMFNQASDDEFEEGFSLYLATCQFRAQIVNVQNIMCTIWIYDLTARRDQSQGDINPVEDWEAGIDAQGGSSSDYKYPYSTPFQSKRFCQKWKVRKVTRALVAPGETHVHMVTGHVYNKLTNTRIFNFVNSEATGSSAVGGLTSTIMVVALGGVWNDVTDKSAVGYSPVNLDICYTKRYKFMGSKLDRVSYGVSSGLSNVETGQLLEEVDASPEPLKTA